MALAAAVALGSFAAPPALRAQPAVPAPLAAPNTLRAQPVAPTPLATPNALPAQPTAPAPAAALPAAGSSAGQAAPSLSVSVALPGGAATVGERLEAIVTLRVPATARLAAAPRFPAWRDAWGEAEVREHGEAHRVTGGAAAGSGTAAGTGPGGGTPSTAGQGGAAAGAAGGQGAAGAAVYSQRLVLVAFRPGRVELPPEAIAVPLASGTVQAWTPAHLALNVRSVLPAGAKDLKRKAATALVPLPLGAPFLWTLLALGSLAVAGVWLLWRRERRRRAAGAAAPAAPPPPPLAELLAALDRLAAEPSALALHTGLSQSLRRFLGRSLGFPAPESTTSEIQRRLLGRGWPAAQVRQAVELLRACDLVKFARQEAAAERGRERLTAARRLAEDFAARGEEAAARARQLGAEAAG